MNGNSIEMTREVNLIKEPGINEMISNRIQEVLTNAGINFTISDVFTDDKTNILIGINGSKGTADNYTSDHSLSKDVFTVTSNKFDPYLLQINKNHNKGDILILGDNSGSAYYGLATLEQILNKPITTTYQPPLLRIMPIPNTGVSLKASTDIHTVWKADLACWITANDIK